MNPLVRTELDVFEVLMQDHREIESLFRHFEHLKRAGLDTTSVVLQACAELKMHDTLENAVFYPALGAAAGTEPLGRLLDQAEAEHDTMLELIEKMENAADDSKARDASFVVLIEHVKQHVLTEEGELFPVARKLAQLEMAPLMRALRERKAQLVVECGLAEADAAAA